MYSRVLVNPIECSLVMCNIAHVMCSEVWGTVCQQLVPMIYMVSV